MILSDFHIHTKLCGHADGESSDYAREAMRKGLCEIGFSDHLPFVYFDKFSYTMSSDELPHYHRTLEELKGKFPNLVINIGVEADYVEGRVDEVRKHLDAYPYDFVIGSVHYIGEWAFDDPDPDQRGRWEGADVDQIYTKYYQLLQKSARTRAFDIIGHADLVKKFGHRPTKDLTGLIEETAVAFKESGVVVEINTSGLRKPVKEIFPDLKTLKIYRKHKVPIIFGSDAHTPLDVGANFDLAQELALEAGYSEYVVLRNRKVERIEKIV